MSQMAEQVARLIANRLAGGGAVFLPDVGSLFVVFHGAEQISKRWIRPPYRQVDFTSQERGESLPDLIARAASCDAAAARSVYDRWLEQTRKAETLTIAGVGTLTFKNFAPTSEFERRLNPQGRAPMRVRRSGGLDWAMLLGVAAILVVAIVVGLYLMQNGRFRKQQVVEPVVAEQTVAEAAAEPVAEAAVSLVADSTEVAQTEVAPTAVVPVRQSTELAVPVSGRHYVVMGVFISLENAEKARAFFAKQQPDWDYPIYRLGSRYMVTCFDSEDEETARNFVRRHRGAFPDIWVHSAR